MKSTKITTKCPCGNELNANIAKPTRITHTVAKLSCGKCGSKFLTKCFKQPDGDIRLEFNAIDITSDAKQAINKPLNRIKSAVNQLKRA